jgi:hypothetical protein
VRIAYSIAYILSTRRAGGQGLGHPKKIELEPGIFTSARAMRGDLWSRSILGRWKTGKGDEAGTGAVRAGTLTFSGIRMLSA